MIVSYDHSLLSVIASLRRFYGLEASVSSNKTMDLLLREKAPEQVFLVLVDGMGSRLISKYLPEDSFLRRHMAFEISTLMPPTTTAVTTSVLTGKCPNETCWLGWMQYLREADDIIVPFRGVSFYSDTAYSPDLFSSIFPVTPMSEELREKGIRALEEFPSFREGGSTSFEELCERLKKHAKEDVSFVYGYYDEYDSLMHRYGPSSPVSIEYLKKVDRDLEELAKELPETTMLIVIADHGQIDIEKVINLKGSHFEQYLIRPPVLEQRCMGFYVKEECRDDFRRDFLECFEEDFILLTREEVRMTHLFGEKEDHPRFKEMVGDFLAIGKTKTVFTYQDPVIPFPLHGQHAGAHPDELFVPVIIA